MLEVGLLEVVLLEVGLVEVVLLEVDLVEVDLVEVVLLEVVLLEVVLLEVGLVEVVLLEVDLVEVDLVEVVLLEVVLLEVGLLEVIWLVGCLALLAPFSLIESYPYTSSCLSPFYQLMYCPSTPMSEWRDRMPMLRNRPLLAPWAASTREETQGSPLLALNHISVLGGCYIPR